LKIRGKGEVSENVKEPVEAPHGMREGTANSRDGGNRKMYPRVSVVLPLEYWGRNDASPQAGISDTLDESGLVMYSVFGDLCVGQELGIRVFFPNGYELDSFKVVATVTRKRAHSEGDWKGYEYGLELIHISEMDRKKLKLSLRNEMTDHTFHSGSDPRRSALA